MTAKQQLLERENRWARRVGFATVLAVVLYLGSIIVEQAGGLVETANDAKQLVSYHEHSGALLVTTIVRAIGSLLLAAPLLYLFKAAEGRTEPEQARRRRNLVAFAVIGPIFFAAQNIVGWIGLRDVSDQFIEMTGGALNSALAKDLIDDSGTLDTATSLAFPAIVGLVIAMIYISLVSLRTGLLTRFTGTMGMALGAALILLGPTGLIAALIWFLYIGLLIGGWLPSGRPPAWAAGEAVPWPVPEKGPGLFGQGGQPAPGDDVVEGRGQELGGGDAPDAPEAPEDPRGELPGPPGRTLDIDEAAPLGETQGQRRKRRKRRN